MKAWKERQAGMKCILRISTSVALIILASCSPSQKAIPTTVKITQMLELTDTPLPATDTPQPTGLPSATPLPLPAKGPWGLVRTDNGIWAFNADGESLRQLTQDKIIGDLAISPSGGKVAYLADYNPDDPNLEKISLRLLSLPDGTIQTISDVMVPLASLVTPTPGGPSGSPTPDLGGFQVDTYSALASGDWSPDGQRLAFVSGHDGLFTNVYMYDLRTGKITRMTDRPHYDYGVKWSPTGEYIFFSEAENMGRGAGKSSGAWVMRADHPEEAPVWGIPVSDTTPDFGMSTWISPNTLLLESYGIICGVYQLSNVDVITGKTQTLWQAAEWGDCIEHIMRDPVSGDLLLNQIRNNSYDLHIVLLASNGVKLKDVNTGDLRTYLLRGSYPDSLNLVGSAAAVSTSLPETLIPIQSPDGGLWAWLPWPTWPNTGGNGLWIGNAGQPPRQIFSAPVDSFSWSPDGKTMFFYTSANGSLYIAHWPELKLEVFYAALNPPFPYPYWLSVNWVTP